VSAQTRAVTSALDWKTNSDAAVPSANIAVARIDEHPSGAHRGRGLRRRQSAQPGARSGKHLIDPALRDARMLSHRRTS